MREEKLFQNINIIRGSVLFYIFFLVLCLLHSNQSRKHSFARSTLWILHTKQIKTSGWKKRVFVRIRAIVILIVKYKRWWGNCTIEMKIKRLQGVLAVRWQMPSTQLHRYTAHTPYSMCTQSEWVNECLCSTLWPQMIQYVTNSS